MHTCAQDRLHSLAVPGVRDHMLGGALLCAACAVVICSWGVIRECRVSGYGCKRCGLCK